MGAWMPTARAQVCLGDYCVGCPGGSVEAPLPAGCQQTFGTVNSTADVKALAAACECECSSKVAKCEVFEGKNAAINFAQNNENGVFAVIGSIAGAGGGTVAGGPVGTAAGGFAGYTFGQMLDDALGK